LKPSRLLALVALLLLSALLLLHPRVSAGSPQPDIAGTGDINVPLTISFHSETDLVESGRELPITVNVAYLDGIPVPGAGIEVLADGAIARPWFGTTDSAGSFRFTYSASAEAERHLLIVVKADMDGTSGGIGRMSTVVMPVMGVGGSQIPVGPAVGLAVLASLGVASTEYGKYGLFKFLVFPLYSRLKKEEVLDHFVRGQIYGYIRANPGAHFNHLKTSLRVNNGTLAHHLRTLEMQGFLKSKRDGMFKRFYAIDVEIPSDGGIRLSDLQTKILDMVNGTDGTTQAEIAAKLNVSQQAVSYNLQMMSREGMVAVERTGRERRYYAASA